MRITKKAGFTLIELLIVIAVVGVLSVGVLVSINVVSVISGANLAKAKTFAASVENNLSINQVGKWSFEEGASPSKDTSGYGNDGVWSGTISQQNAATCGLGFGGCLSFNGGYVDTGNGNSLTFGTGDFSLEAWIYPNSVTPGYKLIFSKMNGWNIGGVNAGYWMGVYNNGIMVGVYDGTAQRYGSSPASSIATSKWQHVVAGRINGNAFIYINGVPQTITMGGLGNFAANVDNATALRLGYDSVIARIFNGLIDEVQIYSQALTFSQIQQLYAQGLKKHQLARN